MAFSDSDKFRWSTDSYEGPVHHRDLGEKDGYLYSKSVRWADVALDGVGLEQTFEYEDQIMQLEQSSDSNSPRGRIIVNGKENVDNDETSVSVDVRGETWIKRLGQIHVNQVSKVSKVSKDKWLTKKSKSTTDFQKERNNHESDVFHQIIETNDLGQIGKHVLQWQWSGGGQRKFCPPIHWITPVKRWDLIWSKMDELHNGYKRDYHYIKPGEINNDGVHGPAIYFFDKDSTDLNFKFNWSLDFIYGEVNPEMSGYARDWVKHGMPKESEIFYNSFRPYHDSSPLPGPNQRMIDWEYNETECVMGPSLQSTYETHKDEYLNYPSNESFNGYTRLWIALSPDPRRDIYWSRQAAPNPHI